ncbi:hypothetical protein LCGC14_3070510 [marine sediment metagenome]|uniref:Uncharacterized protein n=1 Tax=marine sediment metagenome TaxID=412755 RepID=A0A0F8Z6U9_9ZZZZ|nr:hypothetical protein [bacterium]
MSNEPKEVKPQPKKVLSPEELAKVFMSEYQALCEKHGMDISIKPVFKATNHGSYEVILQQSVQKLPKAN